MIVQNANNLEALYWQKRFLVWSGISSLLFLSLLALSLLVFLIFKNERLERKSFVCFGSLFALSFVATVSILFSSIVLKDMGWFGPAISVPMGLFFAFSWYQWLWSPKSDEKNKSPKRFFIWSTLTFSSWGAFFFLILLNIRTIG